MKTVIDNIREMAEGISELLSALLLGHSSLYLWNNSNGPVVVISPYGDYAYRELSEAGRQLQARTLEEYRRLISLFKALLREQPKDVLKELSDTENVLIRTIEQQDTWCRTTQEAFEKAKEALDTQFSFLKNLYDSSAGEMIFVPDTNALLYSSALEKWEFDGVTSFVVILGPTILSELDALKINHRNEIIRRKAETIINQVKEFRRRGRLADGVTLVRGRSTLSTIATEPNMQDSLPWLDSTNNDDRFLATIIEVMRLHPRSSVLAVSRDINFQNKAEFARVPFIEPPDPIADL